jgi:hypothetical protein
MPDSTNFGVGGKNATDEREKNDVSEQIREWQSFRPERSAPASNRQ